jgi:hypothetical protein
MDQPVVADVRELLASLVTAFCGDELVRLSAMLIVA